MINTKQVVPALVAVTLLSLAPAAEALAREEHAQAAKPAAVAADKPAAAKPAEAKADTKTCLLYTSQQLLAATDIFPQQANPLFRFPPDGTSFARPPRQSKIFGRGAWRRRGTVL